MLLLQLLLLFLLLVPLLLALLLQWPWGGAGEEVRPPTAYRQAIVLSLVPQACGIPDCKDKAISKKHKSVHAFH